VKVTADTQVLVRAVVRDDPVQAKAAAKVLQNATLIAVALPSLWELVWVLRKVYGVAALDAASAIRACWLRPT
jgi:predicted nucleic-acid-binding protein